MKKYKLTNLSDADEYEVEEIEETNTVSDDETTLTPEEIANLKELSKNIGKIMKLISVEEDEHDTTFDANEGIEETETEVKNEEKVIDTEKVRNCDSVKAFGSVEKNISKTVVDSIEDDIADAWNKRFNGGK